MSFWTNTILLGAGDAGPNITFVASETAVVAATTWTVNKPAGVQTGDLLIMGIFAVTSMTSNTPPAGWTLLSSDYTAAAGPRHAIYSKVADGSEGATISVSGQATAKFGFVMAFRGASLVGTVGTFTRAGSTTTGTAPSISPATTGALIAIFANDSNRTISTPPSGMTQDALLSSSSGSVAGFHLIPSGAGATGTKSIVWSGSSGVLSMLLQIN